MLREGVYIHKQIYKSISYFTYYSRKKSKSLRSEKDLKYVGNDRKRSSRAQSPLTYFLDFQSRRMKSPKSFSELSSVEGLEGPKWNM